MRWEHLDVAGEMGVEEGIKCAGCHTVIHDLIFFPRDWDSTEAQQILQAVGDNQIDPYSLGFCPDCKSGLEATPKKRKG